MPENLTRQILQEHLVDGELKPGTPIGLRVDQTLLQDATGTMACMQFEQLDVDRVRVDRAVQYIDHNIIQLDFKNPDDHRFLQDLCRKHGAYYSRAGNGISHYISLERFARPGEVLVGPLTYRLTRHAFAYESLGDVALKGKMGSVLVHRLKGPLDTPREARGLDMLGLSAPLIGRDAELARMIGSLDLASGGAAQLARCIVACAKGKNRVERRLRRRRGRQRRKTERKAQ